ncbi:MAG: autotransporter domain-containing protein, partial [Mixta calida]|nr:autotransporter domain-containing protein [Mixta calida]
MQKTAIATMLAALYLTQPLYAMENNIVYGAQNNPVFQVRFFEPGDGPFMSGETEQSQPLTSTWSLDQQQKDKILQALRYWAQVITPQPGALPAIINVGTFDEENAVGNSEPVAKDGSLINMLAMALQGEKPGALTFGSHGQ